MKYKTKLAIKKTDRTPIKIKGIDDRPVLQTRDPIKATANKEPQTKESLLGSKPGYTMICHFHFFSFLVIY